MTPLNKRRYWEVRAQQYYNRLEELRKLSAVNEGHHDRLYVQISRLEAAYQDAQDRLKEVSHDTG